MKQTLLVLLTIFKLVIVCNLLTLDIERGEVDYYNPKYISQMEIDSFHYNRTMKMLNITTNFLKPVGTDNDYMDGTAFIFLSNRYVLSGIQGKLKIKDALNYAFFNLKELLVQHMLPPITKWPLEAGKYIAYNIYMPSIGLPNIPEGRYKIVFKLILRNEVANRLTYYVNLH